MSEVEMSRLGRWITVTVLFAAGCNDMPMNTYEDAQAFETALDVARDHGSPADVYDAVDSLGDADAGMDAVDGTSEGGCAQPDGAMCPSVANADTACMSGSCGFVCHTGFADCDMITASGCEVDTNNDRNNCGGCGHTCSGATNAMPACVAGTCTIMCTGGWADCDGSASNGCEVNVQTSLSHCGTCGTTCSGAPNAAPLCSGGTCTVQCNAGYADCNSDLSDGCETNIAGSTTNCGMCGHVCTAGPHVVTPACSSGACSIGTCSVGYFDCNGSAGDGCEVNAQTDANNCGSCGHACPAVTPTCTSGTCL